MYRRGCSKNWHRKGPLKSPKPENTAFCRRSSTPTVHETRWRSFGTVPVQWGKAYLRPTTSESLGEGGWVQAPVFLGLSTGTAPELLPLVFLVLTGLGITVLLKRSSDWCFSSRNLAYQCFLTPHNRSNKKWFKQLLKCIYHVQGPVVGTQHQFIANLHKSLQVAGPSLRDKDTKAERSNHLF